MRRASITRLKRLNTVQAEPTTNRRAEESLGCGTAAGWVAGVVVVGTGGGFGGVVVVVAGVPANGGISGTV